VTARKTADPVIPGIDEVDSNRSQSRMIRTADQWGSPLYRHGALNTAHRFLKLKLTRCATIRDSCSNEYTSEQFHSVFRIPPRLTSHDHSFESGPD
jgi:hypothetical protein